jgi:hypothetical protein
VGIGTGAPERGQADTGLFETGRLAGREDGALAGGALAGERCAGGALAGERCEGERCAGGALAGERCKGGALETGRCAGGELDGAALATGRCDAASGLALGLVVSGKRMLMTSAMLSVALCTPACPLFTS